MGHHLRLFVTLCFFAVALCISPTFAARTAFYKINPSACQAGPICCCAEGNLVLTTSKISGKIHISADLPGGPQCGGKTHVESDFDLFSSTHATFAEPGTPLVVTARLTPDFQTIAFSNNLQQCVSIGVLTGATDAHSFSTLSRLPENTSSFGAIAGFSGQNVEQHHETTFGIPPQNHHQQVFGALNQQFHPQQFHPHNTLQFGQQPFHHQGQFNTFGVGNQGNRHNGFQNHHLNTLQLQTNFVPQAVPGF